MESFNNRFEQEGGNLYDLQNQNTNLKQQGGGKCKLSPRSQNWKKKYLEMKMKYDNLNDENKKLKKKLQKFESNS